MVVVIYRSDGRGFVVWERTRFFPPCIVGWLGSFCRDVCGGLERQSGPGCATCSPSQVDVVLYPGSYRVGVCLYCTGVILVLACRHRSRPHISCTVQVLFPSWSAGIAPPHTHTLFVGGPGCD